MKQGVLPRLSISVSKKSGSNLGQATFAVVFVGAQVRKVEITFTAFLSAKSGFFRKNAHCQ
jgi:hypothetical protein